MAKSMLKTSQGPAERDLPYLQGFVQAVLSNLSADIMLVNGQIHAYNLKDLAESDFLCQVHAAMSFLFNVLVKDA